MKKTQKIDLLPAKKLLNQQELVISLNKLHALLNFPGDVLDYDDLCLKMIYGFAEFVQQLPSTEDSYYFNSHGLLLQSLNRCCIATTKCRQFLLADAGADTPVSKKYALWMYVIFSSSLLHRLGHTINKIAVTLFDQQHNELSAWRPLQGAMLATPGASCYEYLFKQDNDHYLSLALTRFFAYQLMPQAGFNWISEDLSVFKVWLSLIDENWQGSGSFASMIPYAQIESVLEYFKQKKLQAEARPKVRTDTLFDLANKPSDSSPFLTGQAVDLASAEAGIAFLKWLQKEFSHPQQINALVNKEKSPIHHIREGVLLTFPNFMNLIKDFLKETGNAKFGDWQNVLEQFTKLGITSPDSNNNHVRQVKLGSTDQNAIARAILIRDPNVIFIEGTPPEGRIPYTLIEPKAVLDTVTPDPSKQATNSENQGITIDAPPKPPSPTL